MLQDPAPQPRTRKTLARLGILFVLAAAGLYLYSSGVYRGSSTTNNAPAPRDKDKLGIGSFSPQEVEADFQSLEREGKLNFDPVGESTTVAASDVPVEARYFLPRNPDAASAAVYSSYGNGAYGISYQIQGINVWENYSNLVKNSKQLDWRLVFGKRTPAASIIEVETPSQRLRVMQAWTGPDSARVYIYSQPIL